MRKLREPRLVAMTAACSAVLALVVACSSSDDDSSTSNTGGTGATGGSASGGKGGAASGGTSAHAGSGGAAAQAGSGNAGASSGGGGAANGGGGAANGGGGASNGGGGAANGGGGASNGGGGASSGGSGGASGHAGTGGASAGTGGTSSGGGGAGGATGGSGGASGGAGGASAGSGGSGGSGGFTPVPITLQNPGFETGNGNQNGTVQGWTVVADASETLTSVGSYINYQQSGAHSGYGYLAYYTDPTTGSAYKVSTSQQATGLANGTYEIDAWIEGASSGENAFYIYAKDYSSNASDELMQNVAPTGTYTKYTLGSIQVTSGKLTIGFYADAVKGTWINIDDVTLTRVQ